MLFWAGRSSSAVTRAVLSVLLASVPLAALVIVVLVQRAQGLLGPWYVEMLLGVAVMVCCSAAAGTRGLLAGGVAVAALLLVASSAAVPADLLQRTPFALIASLAEVLLLGAGAAAGLRMLDRATREADARAVDSMMVHSEQRALETATRDQRELQRTLHDTALNTLEAVAHHGDRLDPGTVARRCRADALVVSQWLEGAGSTSSVVWSDALGEELARARSWGLTPEVGAEIMRGGEGLPPDVVVAVAGALREALLNVAKHSGATAVAIDGSATEEGIELSVRDHGRGFALRHVEEAGGVAQSIQRRMEQVGGSAQIASSPGEGTAVLLCWAPSVPEPAPDPESWQPRLASIVMIVSLGVLVVDGLFLTVAWDAWSHPLVALVSWALPLLWLLWLWRGHAVGRAPSLPDAVATLGVFTASSFLATVSDPFCVAPLGELSGADGRLLLVATLTVLVPSRTLFLVSSVTVVAVSLLSAVAWHEAWPLCGSGSIAEAVLGVLLLVVLRALGAALAREARDTASAVRAATAARTEIRRQALLAFELVTWTAAVLGSVAELLEQLAATGEQGRAAGAVARRRCAHLAQSLRAVLSVGAGSEPFQRALRAWVVAHLDERIGVTVRGRVDDLRPPTDVADEVLAAFARVTGPSDVVVLGWHDEAQEGLILTVEAVVDPSLGGVPAGPIERTDRFTFNDTAPAEATSHDWVWQVGAGDVTA